MINDKYPVILKESSVFGFPLLKIGFLGILAYYVLEMINRVYFFTPDIELGMPEETWRIIDSSIYAVSLIIISFQMVVWRERLEAYENRKKARNAFLTLIFAGIFTALYEILFVEMEKLQPSKRTDLSVPFLFMIILHFYSFITVKQLIHLIGRSKKTNTGNSFFYVLFALNPCIRYILVFLLLILTSVAGDFYIYFLLYADLIMTYLTAMISVGAFVFLLIDSRKISNAHLIGAMSKKPDRISEDEESRYQAKRITEVLKKGEVSIFCPNCAIKVDSDSKICEKCGTSLEKAKKK